MKLSTSKHKKSRLQPSVIVRLKSGFTSTVEIINICKDIYLLYRFVFVMLLGQTIVNSLLPLLASSNRDKSFCSTNEMTADFSFAILTTHNCHQKARNHFYPVEHLNC